MGLDNRTSDCCYLNEALQWRSTVDTEYNTREPVSKRAPNEVP
jgi:hypothetical protein